MNKLTSLELSTTKEIINIGLAKAADSLSFFMRDKVLIRSVDFEIKNIESITNMPSIQGEICYVLITHIIGELKGICYLFFSKEEAEKIFKLSLPESVISSPEKMAIMAPAVLLEIDNIVSASVITQFSNLLKYKIHGSVPAIKEIHPSAFKDYLLLNSDQDDVFISFKAEFIASGHNFDPEFIWIINKELFDGVQNFLINSENIEKLKKLSAEVEINSVFPN